MRRSPDPGIPDTVLAAPLGISTDEVHDLMRGVQASPRRHLYRLRAAQVASAPEVIAD